MPSADIRSNRCVPLRGTSAGYASASSAFIKFLKSGSGREALASPCWVTRWREQYRRYCMLVNTSGHIFFTAHKKARSVAGYGLGREGQIQEARRWAGLALKLLCGVQPSSG